MWVFIGYTYISKHSIIPCSVRVGSHVIDFAESKRVALNLIKGVSPAGYVADDTTIYYPVYSAVPTSDKVFPIGEVLSSGREVGDVCELLKMYHLLRFEEMKDEKKKVVKTFKVFPVIVVYDNGVWEHLSLSPYKFVEKGVPMIVDSLGLGVVKVEASAEMKRKYVFSILSTPTSAIVESVCEQKKR